MSNLGQFLAYAAAFEQTFADDDWSRLAPFFTDDATYEVSGLAAATRLVGRDAILRGMKKSLDGFDRKMAVRQIVPTKPPVETGDRVTFAGYVRYQRLGTPTIDMHATIVVDFADDKIHHMHDTFSLGPQEMAWLGQHARDLDGSYT